MFSCWTHAAEALRVSSIWTLTAASPISYVTRSKRDKDDSSERAPEHENSVTRISARGFIKVRWHRETLEGADEIHTWRIIVMMIRMPQTALTGDVNEPRRHWVTYSWEMQHTVILFMSLCSCIHASILGECQAHKIHSFCIYCSLKKWSTASGRNHSVNIRVIFITYHTVFQFIPWMFSSDPIMGKIK